MGEQVLIHPFAERGLGAAPFKLVGHYSLPSPYLAEQNPAAYQNALREMPQGWGIGSCAYCGMALVNNFLILAANGRKFVVGSECVRRVGDAQLVSQAEAIERKARREKQRAKRAAKFAAAQASWEAQLAAERAANGGLTNREVAERQAEQEREAIRAERTRQNWWLIQALRGRGPFAEEMAVRLESQAPNEENFSPRQLAIMGEIYAKGFGRAGSKAFEKAHAEFEEKIH